ncbi:MAG: Holliday junction branch migration protein RuvA [bacterium]|nr:Holliday junction branch migration protein RuvA [bacterium]
MISYIKGQLTEIFEDAIVVENQGIGYEIHVPLSLFGLLPPIGREVQIFTYFQVREDAMSLYGFFNRQDLFMFQSLLAVSGIGPKAALAILSALKPDELRLAIFNADAKSIAKAPGVGAKTAQRVILELKDKITAEEVLPLSLLQGSQEVVSVGGNAATEAVEALVALGYGMTEASRAVKQVGAGEEASAEEILKKALRFLL